MRIHTEHHNLILVMVIFFGKGIFVCFQFRPVCNCINHPKFIHFTPVLPFYVELFRVLKPIYPGPQPFRSGSVAVVGLVTLPSFPIFSKTDFRAVGIISTHYIQVVLTGKSDPGAVGRKC